MDTDKQYRPAGNYERLTVGAVIVYLMRPEQLPTNPEREWRGKVVKVYSSAARGGAVELLEAGHEGLTELVYTEQVIRIEYAGWIGRSPTNK